ncbi:MAG: hypothetical protein RR916_06580 [Anaerorhabdus sp.]|uniref:hypothetical protein n=1 Tax=Anaerorhabdus sp. TaxID=1872524 RepID=UPI002FC96C46
MLFIVSGCSFDSAKHTIILDNSTLEFGTEVPDSCELIKSIDNKTIKKESIHDHNIEQGDIKATCDKVDLNRIGKQDFKVNVNGKPTILSLEIKDTTPPQILIDKEYFEVTKDNPYFDIKKLVSVKDAFDRDPFVGITGSYDLSVIGTYKVKVTAKDSFKNESNKTISINVKEKDIQVVEVPSNTPPPNINNGSNNTPSAPNQDEITNVPPIINKLPPAVNSYTPANKQFLFAEGYNKNTALSACQSYRNEQISQSHYIGNASCSILYDAQNEPYGYQATFN